MTFSAISVPVLGMKTAKKTGRKQVNFDHPVTGLPVVGLSKMTDGRWRIIGTQIRFSEADPLKAIARFHALQRGETVPTVHLEFPLGQVHPVLKLDGSEPTSFIAEADEAMLWQWVAEQIRLRPKYVAAQTGIEQIGYLTDLKPPEALPSLADLKANWDQFAKVVRTHHRNVVLSWEDFLKTTKVKAITDITPSLAIAFRDEVHARGWTGKAQSNLFSNVRRMLSFTKDRAIAVKAISEALNALSLLKPNEQATSLDPKPIEVGDWKKLLEAAKGEDRAMILLGLNAAMYLEEITRLKWSEIKGGCIITNREKKGRVVRVATLWKETIDALDALPRKGEHLFIGEQGTRLTFSGATKRFTKLRTAAKVPHVTSSMLRDGAYTAAVAANVNQQLCNLLAGHRCGIQDHYVKRQPQMVKPATDAIYAAYFG